MMGSYVWVMAFIGGVIGTLVGPTTSFVIYGILGILSCVTQQDIFFTTYIQNIIFLPCICFTGAVAGVALAANKKDYNISGLSGKRSLYFTNDISVYMIGGCFGVIGYLLLKIIEYLNIPIDAGALSVILSAIIIRKVISNGTIITCKKQHIRYVGKYLKMNWVNTVIVPSILSVLVGIVVFITKDMFICFFASAASLIFIELEPQFPVTHQVTLVAGYAAAQFTSIEYAIVAAVIFGVLAQIIYEIVSVLMNYGLFYDEQNNNTKVSKSHFDAPAVAMATLSFVIFTLYR